MQFYSLRMECGIPFLPSQISYALSISAFSVHFSWHKRITLLLSWVECHDMLGIIQVLPYSVMTHAHPLNLSKDLPNGIIVLIVVSFICARGPSWFYVLLSSTPETAVSKAIDQWRELRWHYLPNIECICGKILSGGPMDQSI